MSVCADVVEHRLVALLDRLFPQHHARALSVVQLADRVGAPGITADAPRRLLGHLDLGDQVADRRIPAGKVDARFLADQAATAVAPDQILRAQGTAVGQLDVHAVRVLRETGDRAPAMDGHGQLGDPLGQDELDAVLPQRQPVVVARREVADVERD